MLDPLYDLSDHVVHTECLLRHPEAAFNQERLDRSRHPYPASCDWCGKEIWRVKDPIAIPYLRFVSGELRAELSEKFFHRDCFRSLPDRDRLLEALRESSGAATSRAVQDVIWEFEHTDEPPAD